MLRLPTEQLLLSHPLCVSIHNTNVHGLVFLLRLASLVCDNLISVTWSNLGGMYLQPLVCICVY